MKLTKQTLSRRGEQVYADFTLPEKVLQFGEGEFLRGFADWMIHRMNNNGLFGGRIVVIQNSPEGSVAELNEQDGLYTMLLRGVRNGTAVENREIVSSISRGINPYEDYEAFLACAANPDLRVIVSHTGPDALTFRSEDRPDDRPPVSFAGKLTAFLYRRFTQFSGDHTKGFILLPCEPADQNGEILKRLVLTYAQNWGLPAGFSWWLMNSNHFLNTLVDRIVTGFPKDEIERLEAELGYEDALLNAGEVFHLWVIEGERELELELPFAEAGLRVIWTDDLSPYRNRNVRIMNGAHTMTVLAAFLAGQDTVDGCTRDEPIRRFIREGIMEEVIPNLMVHDEELRRFASALFERFANPFIRHDLLSLTSYSVSRFRVRVLPSLLEYMGRFGKVPRVLSLSLAALIAFYRGAEIRTNALIGSRDGAEYRIIDDRLVLEFFRDIWTGYDGSEESLERLCRTVLENRTLWGMDLTKHASLAEAVCEGLSGIIRNGMRETLKTRL